MTEADISGQGNWTFKNLKFSRRRQPERWCETGCLGLLPGWGAAASMGACTGLKTESHGWMTGRILWTKAALEADYLDRALKLERNGVCGRWCSWQRWERAVEGAQVAWCVGSVRIVSDNRLQTGRIWGPTVINPWFLWYLCVLPSVNVRGCVARNVPRLSFF